MIKKKKKKKEGNFRLFQPYSRPILAVSACFGCFRLVSAVSAAGRYDPIWLIQPDFGRISPVRRESKPIRHESSRIGANQAESARIWEKKKKLKQTDERATASNTGATPLVPRSCFLAHYKTRNCGFNCNHNMAHLDSSGQKPIVGKNHTAGKYWWSYEELAAAISVKSGAALLWEVASPTQMVTTRTRGV